MNENTRKIIGKRLEQALSIRGIKQKELAEHLGIPDNTISYFISGRRTPNHEQMIEISRFLNVSTDFLYGLSGAFTLDEEIQFISRYTGLSEKIIDGFHWHIGSASSLDDQDISNSLGNIINHVLECPDFYTAIENYNSFLELWKSIVNRYSQHGEKLDYVLLADLGQELKEARMERFEAIDNLTRSLTSYESNYDNFLHAYKSALDDFWHGNAGDTNGNDSEA